MIYLLFAILLFITFFTYIAKKDIFHPAFLLAACYSFSCFVAVLNAKEIGRDIGLTTVFVISGSVVLFVAPCLLFGNKSNDKNIPYRVFNVPKKIKIVFLLFMLIIDYFYFLYVLDMARKGGYMGGIKNIFTYAQETIYGDDSEASMNFFLNYGLKIARGIGYMASFELVQNFVFGRARKEKMSTIILLLTVSSFLFQCLLSTGRTQLIHLFVFMLSIFIILRRRKSNWSLKDNKRIAFIMLLVSAVGLIVFRIVGVELRGSIYGNTSTTMGTMVKYIAGPIFALDDYLSNVTHSSYFGEETLYSLYSFLGKLGFDFKAGANNLEFVNFSYMGKMTTINVYGAIRRYIYDYGFLIAPIVILEGLLFGFLYRKVKNTGCNSFLFLFYAKSIYCLVFFFFEERLLTDFLTFSNFMTMITMYLLYRLFSQRTVVYNRSITNGGVVQSQLSN